MMRKLLASFLLFLTLSAASAQCVTGSLPFNLTNGSTADASQVMANYNYIVNQVNANCATSGANSNITALTGLTTPLSAGQGGSQVYTGGTSTGSANAQVVSSGITPTGFSLVGKPIACFTAGATNTSSMTLAYNGTAATAVLKKTPFGTANLSGGEIVISSYICAQYDGSFYELLSQVPEQFWSLTSATALTVSTILTNTQSGSYIILNTNTGFTVTLPSPAVFANAQIVTFLINNNVSGTNTLSTPSGVFKGIGSSGTTSQTLTANTQYLVIADGTNYWIWPLAPVSNIPTIQAFTSGGTYTPTAGTKWAEITMCGAGGGGGASITSAGSAGGSTAFGSWTAIAGSGGTNGASNVIGSPGGAGGSGGASGSGTTRTRMAGNSGSMGAQGGGGTPAWGGMGGAGPWGGTAGQASNSSGGSAIANSCAGGNGGASGGTPAAGAGGGAGEFVSFIMTAAQIGASQTVTIGSGGSGGGSGNAGGTGGSAYVVVTEHFVPY